MAIQHYALTRPARMEALEPEAALPEDPAAADADGANPQRESDPATEAAGATSLLDRLPPAPYRPVLAARCWIAERDAADLIDEPAVLTQPGRPAATRPTPPAPPASPPPPPPSAAYIGERAADPAWLQQREAALLAVRADYEAARAQALASPGAAPGWIPATLTTDESGQTYSFSGAPTVFVPEPGAQAPLIGWDEGGPVYGALPGRTLEWSEASFAAHYRSQAGAPLQRLAALYDTDAASLLAAHPGLWHIATSDHAINAGPARAGEAMGDAGQLGMLDLYLADPQIAALIDAHGGTAAPASSGVAPEQVRIYGAQRYAQLTRLSQAMASVREQYTSALAQAQAGGSGPGWVERQRTGWVSVDAGESSTSVVAPLYLTDENGQVLRDASGTPIVATERVFDPDAFTEWYVAQGGLQHEAFAAFYGRSHTQWGSDESGAAIATTTTFDNPNWSVGGWGGGMQHRELVSLDPNRPPDLNDDRVVGFDLEAGWATPHGNIHEDRDWFETVIQVAFVAAVSYVSAGTLGAAAASAVGGGLAGAAASAAVVGAAASVASGALSGNLTLKGVLQGSLSGALTAGLMSGVNAAFPAMGTVGTIAARTTIQGGIQALLGGSFRDGAIAGFASGLAEAAGAGINAKVDEALRSGAMSAAEAATARTFARILGSAIRAAANPDDPAHAFASEFLGSTLNQLDPAEFRPPPSPATQTAFDDEGDLVPGIVDPNTSYEEQQAQLAAQLVRQGMDPTLAQQTARGHYAGAILIRDEAIRVSQQAEQIDAARSEIDSFETGSSTELVADASGAPPASLERVQRLQANLDRLAEADSPFLVERNQVFLRAQIEKYLAQEARAQADGDLQLQRALQVERQMFESTLTRLDARFTEIDYGVAALRFADRLASRGGAGFSRQEIVQAVQRFVAGTSADGSAVDEFVRRALAGEDPRLYLTILGGGSIAALVGQDGTGAGSPRLQRVPGGSVQVPATGYRYNFDELGRVSSAHADLRLGTGARNPQQQRGAGGADRLPNDDGGHIVGNRFNPPTEEFNLFAQNRSFNRGVYNRLEASWAGALGAGQNVQVEWRFAYTTSSIRPDSLMVRYSINGGPVIEVPFVNVPRGGR
jgi:hypothetical protein